MKRTEMEREHQLFVFGWFLFFLVCSRLCRVIADVVDEIARMWKKMALRTIFATVMK